MIAYYMTIVLCCLWIHHATAAPSSSDDLRDWMRAKDRNVREKRSAAERPSDTDNIMLARMILREIAEGIKSESNNRNLEYDRDDGIVTRDYISKRKPFWQPMGGPLPVETRLASFGQKIIPDESHETPNRFKAMRYGRR